jgi:hypothetical protein
MNERIYRLIEHEVVRAERLHPYWPEDIIHMVSIMNEEAGESIRAALNYMYHDESLDAVIEELIQTAAMCVRCLEHLQDYE